MSPIRGIVGADGSATFDGAPVPPSGIHAVVDGWVAGGGDVARLYEEHRERFLDSLRGSFAIAIWDGRERKLVLARDAFGTRPLHHASDHGRFLFASEPAAILGELRGRPHVDPIAIDDVLAFGWTERRRTGYEEIERLYPGEIAVYCAGRLERRTWWRTPRTTAPRPGEALIRELERSVRACLGEGGAPALILSFDTGSVVLLQTLARVCEPVRTYSAAIEGSRLHTLPLAERVGAQQHCEVTVAAKDLPQVVEETLAALDAPLADPELVLLRLACKAARRETRVCLIADGGEQVLGTGARYAWMRTEGSRPRPPLPLVPVYLAIAGALSFVGSTRLRTGLRTRIDDEERRYVSSLVATENVLRRRLFAKLRRSAHRRNESERELWNDFGIADELDARMRRHDLRHALPNGILARSQRAATPYGLELRFPYLHPDVLAEAGSIPLATGAGEGPSVARRMLPALPPLVDGYLVGSRLAADGWLSQSTIAAVIRSHRRRSEFGRTIFALLALEIWYRKRIRAS